MNSEFATIKTSASYKLSECIERWNGKKRQNNAQDNLFIILIETKMANEQTDDSKTTDSCSLLKASCDLEYLLIGDIRKLLSEKFDLQTRSSLLVLLNRLIQNLPAVLELSSEEDYLSIVLERRPSWSRQINALYQANLDCVSSLTLVRDCLENDTSIAAISKELELRLRNWVKSFSAMRCQESTMLQEAFTLDLGGEA